MRRTYEDATQALVLDSELEGTSCDAEPEDLMMHITCCDWMCRLWTLQEGALAQRLLFQFDSKAIELKSLESTLWESFVLNFASPIPGDVMSCFASFQKFSKLNGEQLFDLIRALQWRKTSWQQDETICLSILLDLDAERIEKVEPLERMPTFLRMVRTFPLEIMFAPGPRLPQEHFSWAPQSLIPLKSFSLPSCSTSTGAVQTTQGLVTTTTGLRFDTVRVPLQDFCWFNVENDECDYRIRNLGEKEDGGASWQDDGPHLIDSPAIVVDTQNWQDRDVFSGALVAITAEHEKFIHANFHSRVFICRETGDVPSTVMQKMRHAEALQTDMTAIWSTAERIVKKVVGDFLKVQSASSREIIS
ncbi:hypothetical protein EPUS_01506 [Endocarpon pusillum Z07020]|uniref:Heterokaryon incompatibility domain-containing protein n=1 Tax=Endocarpon pusillum (strain Z07020 / HMAS-L-300199) TaxID=1263415 RepID=U1GEX5_ENDPU|nr:uncharacterized protein EPUS_01506 [Endocarpon pusillum Z07020]ERF76172.1 hypothetical protein EPUS_01506 [Endocarpon pusillum Z07020]